MINLFVGLVAIALVALLTIGLVVVVLNRGRQ